MDPIHETNLKAKVNNLLPDLPQSFEALRRIDLNSLADEVMSMEKADQERLERVRRVVTQLEALKMLSSQFYASKVDVLGHLRDGVFYQDLLPLILVFELWGKLWKELGLRNAPKFGVLPRRAGLSLLQEH